MTTPPGPQPRPPRSRPPHAAPGSGHRAPARDESAPGPAPWQRGTEHGTGDGPQNGTGTTAETTPGTTAETIPGTAATPVTPRHPGQGISALSEGLLEVLRCPLTRGRLFPLDERHLMSDRPYREGVHPVYEVIEGIPHMLPAQGDPSATTGAAS